MHVNEYDRHAKCENDGLSGSQVDKGPEGLVKDLFENLFKDPGEIGENEGIFMSRNHTESPIKRTKVVETTTRLNNGNIKNNVTRISESINQSNPEKSQQNSERTDFTFQKNISGESEKKKFTEPRRDVKITRAHSCQKKFMSDKKFNSPTSKQQKQTLLPTRSPLKPTSKNTSINIDASNFNKRKPNMQKKTPSDCSAKFTPTLKFRFPKTSELLRQKYGNSSALNTPHKKNKSGCYGSSPKTKPGFGIPSNFTNLAENIDPRLSKLSTTKSKNYSSTTSDALNNQKLNSTLKDLGSQGKPVNKKPSSPKSNIFSPRSPNLKATTLLTKHPSPKPPPSDATPSSHLQSRRGDRRPDACDTTAEGRHAGDMIPKAYTPSSRVRLRYPTK